MKRIKHILIGAMVLAMAVMFANADIPPTPVELNNNTGEHWVNYTWSEDINPENDNVTDSFNVSMNGMWYNGTAMFLDKSVGPGGWANIEVWAYNATGNGNMSVGSVSGSVQAPGAATEHSHKCGYIPPSMDLSHLDEIPVKRIQAPCAISSFDWRDSNNVTPVKDQDGCGTCWTCGTTSVLESAVLINEGAEYNFSEQSIALCVDRSRTRMYDNNDDPCNAGGNSYIASEVFIKKGSVPESCNPYNITDLNCDGSCICDDCAPVKRVDGYRLVTDNGSEIDVIKNAVHDHGPVTTSFYYTNTSECVNLYNVPTWGTIYDYYPGPESPNHLVSIIGWNDSVPHPDTDHTGTGAWIVKNSWGTGWGNDGYFYLAYNSSCVKEIAYLEYKDPVPGEELLYWDESGFVDGEGYIGNDGAWMASVFTADHSGDVTHIDFWTTSNNAEYEIYVWGGFFGNELTNQTGTCQELGYYSIPLNTPIPMDAGQQFTVGVNMTTPGYNYPIPVECENSGMVSPDIQTNVSFRRHSSIGQWTDLASGGTNACLRARVVATFSCACGDICVNTSGWWRDGGAFNADATTPIQVAVDAASSGDTICVAAGYYTENVNIGTAHLTLVGEGADVVNVRADSTSDPIFDVAADWVNISGFTVIGALNDAGIYLNGRQHCTISDNNASSNYRGIYLSSSSNNTLVGNTANSNGVAPDFPAKPSLSGGIMLEFSSNNTLVGNNASGNDYGIYLDESSSNKLTSNAASDNSNWDIYIDNSPSNTFADNTLNGTTVSFTYSGDVSLEGVGSPEDPPTGLRNISKFISATNQSAGAWMYLNFSYSDSDLNDLVEASLSVWKHNGTAWVKDDWDNGRYLDTTGNVVGVNITTFSVFAPMGVPPLHHINVTPTSKILGVNESQDFRARGYAQDGEEISEYFVFDWAIRDVYIGSFARINDSVTNFTADHVGRTYITARNGSKTSDEVQVTVDDAETNNTSMINGSATTTSGDATVTCDLGGAVTGWINITAIGNATNSSEVNSSKPRDGLGDDDMAVSGVTVNVSQSILDELAAGNGTIRIKICYNATTRAALGIDASTLAIWKYNSTAEKWVKLPSTRSGTCVYVDVSHLCPFGLFGSKAASTPSGSGGGGGGGTYPPGWSDTPAHTITATKGPAADATAAPPGERVTPASTKAKPAAAKTTTTTAEGTATTAQKNGAAGFTMVFVIAGMLAVAYAMMRRRE
ncbi:MAG: C1 family peptidase [Euryarchaeota archaeon]|nr:C1 family peptidase [Euryarchaeota archaeon]